MMTKEEIDRLNAWSRNQAKLQPTYEAMMEAAKSYTKNFGVNLYRCDFCGHSIVTRDLDFGCTPFMIGCEKCNKMATSLCYRVPQTLKHTHEWYRPSRDEFAALDRPSKEHCAKGGLLLKPVVGDANAK